MSTFDLELTSPFGTVGRMAFPIELKERIETWLSAPPSGRLHVQNEFPELDDGHREFLMTGITPEEWARSWDRTQTNRQTRYAPTAASTSTSRAVAVTEPCAAQGVSKNTKRISRTRREGREHAHVRPAGPSPDRSGRRRERPGLRRRHRGHRVLVRRTGV